MESLDSITALIEATPAHLQTLVIFVIIFGLWQFVQAKGWAGPKNGENKAVKHLTDQVDNHLTTAITELTEAVRDMEEQNNRVANTMNVVLDKIDGMRDLMIKIETLTENK
jgi:hypothetical protein